MSLYDTTKEIKAIESKMMEWAESHDGDITDFPLGVELDGLTEAKEEKIVSMALWYKNMLSDAEAIDNEVKKLQKRKKYIDNNADRLKDYIALCLGDGNKLNDPKVVLSWKKSKSVSVFGDVPTEYKRIKTTEEADKVAIKLAIESGEKLDFAEIIEKQNIQIK